MNILDELAQQGDRPTHEQRDRAVRRMKRDRLTIRKMEQRLHWYEGKVTALQNELRRRAALQSEGDSRA